MTKWSRQKKQERNRGGFERSLKGGKRRRTSFFFSAFFFEASFGSHTTFPSLVLSRWVEETSKRHRSIAAGEPVWKKKAASFAMPKWSWQKKQERTRRAFESSLREKKRRSQADLLTSFFSFSFFKARSDALTTFSL